MWDNLMRTALSINALSELNFSNADIQLSGINDLRLEVSLAINYSGLVRFNQCNPFCFSRHEPIFLNNFCAFIFC
jgi:hypothetical protein